MTEELERFKKALALEGENNTSQKVELGNLLFTLVSISRQYNLDPSEALWKSNKSSIQRLSMIETSSNSFSISYTIDELETS